MYNFLTIGYDCSPAVALRDLNLREHALPFDWIVSNVNNIHKCIEENFNRFHRNLSFNHNKKRLIDEYGFEYPHDYPLTNPNLDLSEVGEGIYGEEDDKHIIDNWMDFYQTVHEKYKRRIERFLTIVNSPNPIIVLCRHSLEDVFKLKNIFKTIYNKENIVFINSSDSIYLSDDIMNCYTEKNGIWNDTNVWRECLTAMLESNLIFK